MYITKGERNSMQCKLITLQRKIAEARINEQYDLVDELLGEYNSLKNILATDEKIVSEIPFSVKFKNMMKKRQLTQSVTAELLGYNKTTINMWATGNIVPTEENQRIILAFFKESDSE